MQSPCWGKTARAHVPSFLLLLVRPPSPHLRQWLARHRWPCWDAYAAHEVLLHQVNTPHQQVGVTACTSDNRHTQTHVRYENRRGTPLLPTGLLLLLLHTEGHHTLQPHAGCVGMRWPRSRAASPQSDTQLAAGALLCTCPCLCLPSCLFWLVAEACVLCAPRVCPPLTALALPPCVR